MPPADAPLTRDQVLAAAEDVIRRFGPARATVVAVARALGVSHAAVYRHVATKAELRDLVVGRWVEATMPPLRAIAAQPGPAPQRLRRLLDALIAVKRRRADDDPELFATYLKLAADAQSVVAAHIDEPFELMFMREQPPAADQEIELDPNDCDVVFYEGGTIDLGGAIADTLALSLDPYPRSASAESALKEAGVLSEEQASPCAVLAALKGRMEED